MCVYYCRTYYKAVRGGGGGRRVEDMRYERRRAEACVDESAHHALANLVGVTLSEWGDRGHRPALLSHALSDCVRAYRAVLWVAGVFL